MSVECSVMSGGLVRGVWYNDSPMARLGECKYNDGVCQMV